MPNLAVLLATQNIKFNNSGSLGGRNLPSSFISGTEDLGVWCSLELEKFTLVLVPFPVLSSPVSVASQQQPLAFLICQVFTHAV